MAKPLGFWATPRDRRLPAALLNRSLHQLLQTPFDDLTTLPGVGRRRLASLVTLLERATQTPDSAAEPLDANAHRPAGLTPAIRPDLVDDFDADGVSEAVWDGWRHRVRNQGLGPKPLGWLAPSLQDLPKPLWTVPLASYLDYSLADLRGRRTYGEKRLRGVLGVFHAIDALLTHTAAAGPEASVLRPAFLPPVQAWLELAGSRPEHLHAAELERQLVQPLLQQIRLDAGEAVYRLARSRLGFGVPKRDARDLAREWCVTRARIYQVLDDCSRILDVRWPTGRDALEQLARQLSALPADPAARALLADVRRLCFPTKGEQPSV